MQRFQSCREFELELNNKITMVIDNANGISIGRGDCDIIVSHPKVSQHHADIKIVTQSGYTKYLFQDRSTNGTVIDGKKIHNSEIEIYPQAHPVILLAGTAELKWDTVEETFGKRGNFVNSVDENMKYCSHCGAAINKDAVICVKCGCAVSDPKEHEIKSHEVKTASGRKETEICPKCGVREKAANNVNPGGSETDSRWLTLLLLSIFLGGFGVDRFFVGKIGTGILKLITFGGCGIWWLIDLIMIAVNKFTDSNGNVITKN